MPIMDAEIQVMKKFAILCGVVLFASSSVLAQEGDFERGQALSQTCAACHGPDGNSMAGDFPTIAGQHSKYIAKQLRDYQIGAESGGERGRFDFIMADSVSGLSDQDILDLAAYFSAQELNVIGTDLSEEEIALAQRLYLAGDEDRGITGCAACHGPRGSGMGLAAFPVIGGQHAQYTRKMLEQFRNEERENDPNGMMRDIASQLSEEDIDLLSRYLSGLY